MMKTRINNVTIGGVAVAVGVLLTQPTGVFAVARVDDAPGKSAFCQALLKTDSTIKAEITSRTAKLTAAQAKVDSTRSDTRSKADLDLTAKRSGWDVEREANFAKLDAKATSDEQKSALATYKSTVLGAVKTRREANDQARLTFRTSVDTLVTSHQKDVVGQVSSFRSTVQSAIDVATAACVKDQKTTVVEFRKSLKKARVDFKMQRTADAKIGEQIKALAATRNASVKTNDAVMRATVSAARDDLLLVLKEA